MQVQLSHFKDSLRDDPSHSWYGVMHVEKLTRLRPLLLPFFDTRNVSEMVQVVLITTFVKAIDVGPNEDAKNKKIIPGTN